MREGFDFLSIMRRHFAVFMAAIYLELFAMAMTLFMLLQRYPPSLDDFAEYLVAGSACVSMYLCVTNLLVIRGRPWAVWPNVLAMFACILLVLVHWGQRLIPAPVSFLGLLLPLLALLILNTQRYRTMLETMVQVRWRRAALRKK